MQTSLIEWKKEVSDLRAEYTWLLYFSVPKIFLLYELICSSPEETEGLPEKIIQEVSLLTVSQPSDGVILVGIKVQFML